MDIHKPKPAHSWREFAIEIGTIICGILIALGLEQTVEWLHMRAEVRDAREALREEIAVDAMIARYGLDEDRCLGLSLDKYAAWARGGPRPQPFHGGFPYFRTSAWEEVRSGPVAHMPLKERLALAAFYDEITNQRSVLDLERNAYRPMIGFSEKSDLDAGEAQRLLELVAEARLFGRVRSANGRILIDSARAMGIAPKAYSEIMRKMLAWQCGQGGGDFPPF